MGNFAENLNLGNRFRPPLRLLETIWVCARYSYYFVHHENGRKLLISYCWLYIPDLKFDFRCFWLGVFRSSTLRG